MGSAHSPDGQRTCWAPPGSVTVTGLLGDRFLVNESERLLPLDERTLLIGFQNRPGPQAWIGEHIGKWLHASSFSYQITANPRLKEKMDRLVEGLLATQEQDGYLGTYDPAHRWSRTPGFDWDVWVHKYVLIGLLSYYRITGDEKVLAAARKVGHLLSQTFGPNPGQLDICERSTHVGMAASSVLQPMVWLYRLTGEETFFQFCRYILWSWDHSPYGPKILSTLRQSPKVHRVANAKAYEMMSCLTGVVEFAREVAKKGEVEEAQSLLGTVTRAWEDIVTNRLYITGGTSLGEFFQEDGYLPNGGTVAETCAVVTLLQLTWELFQETGEARFMDVAETIIFNHLLGAQHPTGGRWCYFTPLQGHKEYRHDINCCASSGPRGVAFLPFTIYSLDEDGGIRVNLYCPSKLELKEKAITVTQETEYPYDGRIILRVQTPRPIAIRLRVPTWVRSGTVSKGTKVWQLDSLQGRYLTVEADKEETILIETPMIPEVVKGSGINEGKIAIRRGPLILTLDESLLKDSGRFFNAVTISADQMTRLKIVPKRIEENKEMAPVLFETEGIIHRKGKPGQPFPLLLTDFAFAGARGGRIRVWLPDPTQPAPEESLFAYSRESRSRVGNVAGSICDEDPQTWVVTYDGTKRDEDWFAVESDTPQTVQRIVFLHGQTYHDGGWFDTSEGKPRVEVRRQPEGPWEPIATFDTYPATTATDPKGLRQGQSFELILNEPVTCYGVRIVGKPACGDDPAQAFSSCAELKAFGPAD
ncbi:MAG: glycoside hydrolase family 127 protein [Armatimonadetes bacterium]|nr:glycoside hydrolase family 127 protein [Armatimonadota bacterium]MDW8122830.1 glycoside hydrolase family 127 protein [Armatimonadota bacterium]